MRGSVPRRRRLTEAEQSERRYGNQRSVAEHIAAFDQGNRIASSPSHPHPPGQTFCRECN
jgi:hypothetical protein